jgi:serine/threonine protein kinase
MNFVDGGTLADYIQTTSRKGKFPAPGAVARLFTSIAAAIEYAHDHGVVHGQLKPTNVLLDKRDTSRNVMGEPVVTDFGIYKLRGIMASATSGAGNWQNGSPVYMSPEQISGAPADARSDIYALGIMLYELCAGTTPFQGSNPATIMMQHLNTIPTSPALINPAIPVELTEIIMRCIAKDPAARFPGAAALIEALAQLNENETVTASLAQASPASASKPDYPVKPMDMDLPTIFTRPPQQAGYTPSQPGISGVSFSPVPPTISSPGLAAPLSPSATPYFAGPASQAGASQSHPTLQPGGQSRPMPPTAPVGPLTPMPSTVLYQQSVQNQATASPAPSNKRRRPTLWIALSALLVVLVIGSSLGAYLIFFAKGSSTTTGPAIVGQAYFVSSGLLILDSTTGITDQLQIHLKNVPPPAAGKAYYAWLLNDIKMLWNPVYLGQLTVKSDGAIDFTYPGNTTDLLATNSRFLITEDDAATTPVSPDSGTNVYYAAFPQIPHAISPTLSFSLYDHLRHLLAAEPSLAKVGLTGGLDTWLYHNSQKILEWAGSARDATFAGSGPFINNQLMRIMCYLDGASFITHDLPQASCNDSTVAQGAKVGLLSLPVKGSFGYLQHITTHLHELSTLPEATPQQRALATQIYEALNSVNQRFTSLRSEVLQLLKMPQAQWSQPAGVSLLDSIAALSNDAFVGKADPSGNAIDGVAQINYNIQALATFNVRACTTANPCSIQEQ